MTLSTICSPDSLSVISGSIYPLITITSVFTAIIIGLAYMLGEFISNQKTVLWAKTEAIQLFVSIFCVVVLLQSLSVACALDMGSIYHLFISPTPVLINPSSGTPLSQITVFDSADYYFQFAGNYTHMLLDSARYHIAVYDILQQFMRGKCSSEGATAPFFCLFGSIVQGNGISYMVTSTPDSGYALLNGALSVAFNSLLFSFVSLLNYLFILRYIYTGLPLFFLPLGIFLRALPYLRQVGSLLIAVAFSFLIIYPLVLSLFAIDFLRGDNSILAPCTPAFLFSNEDPASKVNLFNSFSDSIHDTVFKIDSAQTVCGVTYSSDFPSTNIYVGDQSFEILAHAGNAFLICVFIPSIALLCAIASVAYANRFLGEEIDLSRIVQMV